MNTKRTEMKIGITLIILLIPLVVFFYYDLYNNVIEKITRSTKEKIIKGLVFFILILANLLLWASIIKDCDNY